jgi:hypothetical protein
LGGSDFQFADKDELQEQRAKSKEQRAESKQRAWSKEQRTKSLEQAESMEHRAGNTLMPLKTLQHRARANS